MLFCQCSELDMFIQCSTMLCLMCHYIKRSQQIIWAYIEKCISFLVLFSLELTCVAVSFLKKKQPTGVFHNCCVRWRLVKENSWDFHSCDHWKKMRFRLITSNPMCIFMLDWNLAGASHVNFSLLNIGCMLYTVAMWGKGLTLLQCIHSHVYTHIQIHMYHMYTLTFRYFSIWS